MAPGSSRAPLLPEVALALALGAPWQVVALELLAPEGTLRALPSEAALAAAALPRAVTKRRAEFAAGRYAAALALAHAGCSDAVGRAASGAPLWPAGFTGSISHGAGLVVAVIARNSEVAAVGIDVERSISEEQREEIAARILSEVEIGLMAAALPASTPAEHLTLGFSAKESLYKCLSPLVNQFFEFDAARVLDVIPDDANGGRITLGLTRPLSNELPIGFILEGRYAFAPGRIETIVWLPRHSVGIVK